MLVSFFLSVFCLDLRNWNPCNHSLKILKELQRWCIFFKGNFKVLAKLWIPSKIHRKVRFNVRSFQGPDKECIKLKGINLLRKFLQGLFCPLKIFEGVYGLWSIFKGIPWKQGLGKQCIIHSLGMWTIERKSIFLKTESTQNMEDNWGVIRAYFCYIILAF